MNKRIFQFLLISLLSAVLVACNQNEKVETDPATLQLNPATDIVFDAAGGSRTIKVTSDAVWTPSSDQTWCAVQKIDERSFTVTAQPNPSADPRPDATVTVQAGEGPSLNTATLRVSQRGAGEPAPQGSVVIELSEARATEIDMFVTPSSDDFYYYFDVLSEEILREYHNNDLEVYITNLMAEAARQNNGSMADAIEAVCVKGTSSYTFRNLQPKTRYIAFAAGIAEDGTTSTEMVSQAFTTTELQQNVTFQLDIQKTGYHGINATITPSDPEFPYYYTIRAAEAYKRYSDDELLDQILNEDSDMLNYYTMPGVQTIPNEEVLCSDTEYYVLVFGYLRPSPTTPINKFPFRTLAPTTAPEDVTFTVEVSGVTSRSASVGIVANDAHTMYMFDLISQQDYDLHKGKMKEYVTEYVAQEIDRLDYNRVSGESGYLYASVLEPGTTYYVWAATIDEFGKPTADVFVSDSFETLPNLLSDAQVRARVTKYFDGDDLYKMDPATYSDARGKAYVQVEFMTQDCKVWYGGLYLEDPDNPTDNNTDEELIEILLQVGTWCPTGKLYYCDWGSEYVLLGVGVGEDENTGPLFYKKYTFTREGAAPIDQFVAPDLTAAAPSAVALAR